MPPLSPMDVAALGLWPQPAFPQIGRPYELPGEADSTGYTPPDRTRPALRPDGRPWRGRGPSVTLIGTVRNEVPALDRSWRAWSMQRLPPGMTATAWVLDEGSTDDPLAWVKAQHAAGLPPGWALHYAQTRKAGDPGERSCTIAHNAAVAQLVRSPLVLIQWWDRMPGHQDHLAVLLAPHTKAGGLATSAVGRHLGGSSSCDTLAPAQLAALLRLSGWERDLSALARIAGPIGGHCRPGQASESTGLCLPVAEFVALGGFDERYCTRASYVNVEFFRRLFAAGVAVGFVPEPVGANYHQSHPCPTQRQKDYGWLHEPAIRRNTGGWGKAPILARWPK